MDLKDLLKNPPLKKNDCPKCGGRGYINMRGMISSDTCPRCNGARKVWVIDYDAFEAAIRRKRI
uniref:Putative chaperone n=1 Tax=viral metagenome TaxID=1070528 RepID=A0A6M3Y5C2_9ZZZZ